MVDNTGTLVKVGIIGAVAYYAYTQGWLSMLGLTPAAAEAATPAAATPAPNPNAIVGANSLDAISIRVLSAAGTGSRTVDEWNYFLGSAAPQVTPPDPMPLFSAAVPNFDRSQKLTFGQYWGVMAPALKTQMGLSGLGIYGGLAVAARGYRVH